MQVVVVYLLVILGFAFFKRKNAYQSFLNGVENSFQTVKSVFPNVLAIILAIQIFANSGILELLRSWLPTHILVPEIFIQCFFKPISWSSSLLVMTDIFGKYGVDSFIGQLSSLLQGSSDTTIYIVAMYFSSIKMNKYGHSLLAGLLTDFATFVFTIIFAMLLLKM